MPELYRFRTFVIMFFFNIIVIVNCIRDFGKVGQDMGNTKSMIDHGLWMR